MRNMRQYCAPRPQSSPAEPTMLSNTLPDGLASYLPPFTISPFFREIFQKSLIFLWLAEKIYIHQNLHSPGFSILCPPFSIVRHQFLNPHILPFQTPFNEKPINCYRFHLSAINASCLLLTPWIVVMEKFCPVEKISD